MILTGLDIETTGKLDPAHRIIEVSLQNWDYANPAKPECVRAQAWRINPGRTIDPKAYAVHHITLDDLAGEPNFPTAFVQIRHWLSSSTMIVAHNGLGFDRPFLRQEIEREAPGFLERYDATPWFDTMLEGRWAHPQGKVPSLKELCWACDVEYDPTMAHAASYDVSRMMLALGFGLEKGFFSIVP